MSVDGETPTTNNNGNAGGHWSAERLHADVHRAVGGSLNLIRELARISQELDPSVPGEWLIKRALFYSYELHAIIKDEFSARDRLIALNEFFFENKNFRCHSDLKSLSDASDAYRLSRVFALRAGAPSVMALLYSFLAERIGLNLEVVNCRPACFLKWVDDGHSRYVDLARFGATLGSDELIEVLHTHYQMTTVSLTQILEPVSFDRLLSSYIAELKSAFAPHNDHAKLLFLQNALIAYQPSNLQLIAERASLHRRLGHFKSALSDLKRYFAFNERDRAPQELVKMHDELIQLLGRHRSGVEPEPTMPTI